MMNQLPINPAPFWVQMTTPDLNVYWARVSRLLLYVVPAEQQNVLNRLVNGQPVIFEGSNLRLHYLPMPQADQRRLKHLLTFEQPGYRLASFKSDSALYSDGNGFDYYSMGEMLERGYIPKPAISINPSNVKLTTLRGKLLEIFVPVGEAVLNFSALSNDPAVQSKANGYCQ